MSKDDELPKIPSWEELGISPEELKELEEELGKEEEGGAPAAPAPPPKADPAPARPGAKSDSRGTGETPKKRRWGRKKKPATAGPPPPVGSKPPPPPKAPAVALPAAPRFRGPLTVVLLLVVAWLSSSSRGIPRPLPADAPDSVFSADRAWVHLEQIARAAHPPGSPEHVRVRDYLIGTLRSLGLDADVQTTTEVIGRGALARAVTVRNVLARIPGTGSPGAVLITAHYDGRTVSLGAGDDGFGVVAILEAVRALRTGPPLAHDVIVLITDAEELGLVGARAFVNQHPWMADVTLALSFDMRGGGGPVMMFETGAENGWVVRQFAESVSSPSTNSVSYEVYKRLPNDTDFTPFKEAGVQGLNFAAIGRAHLYHQAYDAPPFLSRATLQHHGEQATAMLRHFGDADLSSVDAPDLAYISLPWLGVVSFPPLWSWVASGVLLLLSLAAVGVGRKRGLRPAGMVIGGLLAVGTIAASAAAGWGLLQWLPRFHPEAGHLHGSLFHSEGPYVLALTAAVLATTWLALTLGRRWASIGELAIGAVVLPALAGVVAGPLLPMGAMNLQWPAAAALISALVAVGVGRATRAGWLRWALWMVLAVPVLALMVPLVETLWLAMSFSLAPAIGTLIAVAALFLWPQLDMASEPRGWAGVVWAALGFAVFLGLGIVRARPSAERPLPSTLVYTLDRADGTALWAVEPAVLDADAILRSDHAWARERVGMPDTVRTLPAFLEGLGPYALARAPLIAAPALQISVETESVDAGQVRPVRIRVRSALGAEQLRFTFPDGGARAVSINGRPLTGMPGLTTIDHWGEPVGGAVVLELDPASIRGPVTFDLLEGFLRPAELLGPEAFARPPELAPDITRLSDRVLIRTPVQIDVATGTVTLGALGAAVAPASTDAGSDTAVLADPAVSVELFARDRISTVAPEFALTFGRDGRTAYFNRTDAAREEFALLASLLRGQTWSAPEAVPFASAGRDIDPFVSPDGDRIWFSSDRPRSGSSVQSFSTWYVDRTATGWSEPIDPGAPFNSDSADVFVSQAVDGTLVFSSNRTGKRQVYVTRATATGWETPSALRFGTLEEATHPLIAPDGTYILLSLPGPDGSADLFASCRTGEGWADPRRLPDGINSAFAELAPALHPVDGALFFTSERPGILGPVPDSVRPAGDLYRADPSFRVTCGSTPGSP